MICSNCEEYEIIIKLEEWIVIQNPIDYQNIIQDIFNSETKISDEDFECETCGFPVKKGESYFSNDSFHDEIYAFIGQKIMDKINCCKDCGEGGDIQNICWSVKSIFSEPDDKPDEIIDMIDTASELKDLLSICFYNLGFSWENQLEKIVKYIKCPNCANGSGVDMDEHLNYGSFDLWTEVYTEDDIKRFNKNFYGDDYNDFNFYVSELAQKLSLDELKELENEYIGNKEYIARNLIFSKLEEFIVDLYQNEKWYTLSEKRLVFRTRTAPSGTKLSNDELWEPPYQKSKQGRYNGTGTSVLYCSNNRKVIKQEVHLSDEYEHNIAKIIINKPMRLLPIDYIFDSEFKGLIDETVSDDTQYFKEQYIVGNIVSAICSKSGFDGIVYRSTKDKKSIDYALFSNYKKDIDLKVLDVEK